MANVIGIMNYKGGVGKTTTTMNLGTALWLMGYKVLMIDAEQQCSLTINVGFKNDGKNETLNEWMRGMTDEPPVYERYDGLDYIPSNEGLVEMNQYLSSLRTRNHVLYKLLEIVKPAYDYILIDCAPNKGAMNDNVMVAADGLIIPTDCCDFATSGLSKLKKDIIEMQCNRFLNPDLQLLGVLRTDYNGRLNVSKRTTEFLNEIFGDKIFRTTIRHCSKVNQAPGNFMSMFELDPGSNVAKDYMQLAEEITGKQAKGWFNKAKEAYHKLYQDSTLE